MREEFKTIINETVFERSIERSRFICYLNCVKSEEQAKEYIAKISKQNSLFTHNCYAYIVLNGESVAMRFSDNGEPQGTAGQPMLEALKHNDLFNVVAVVSRDFGGIKLGAGGLVRAYSGVTADCVKQSEIVIESLVYVLKSELTYELYPKFLKFAEQSALEIISTEFLNEVELTIVVKKNEFIQFKDKFTDYFLGKVGFEILEERYHAFKN